MMQVKSAQPVAPWLGGKKHLAARLVAKIEAIDHETYVEPFVGMGGVFLRRRFKPTLEVANDLMAKSSICSGSFSATIRSCWK